METRDKLILCGLFLSKFDRKGLAMLGFNGFTQAYNTLGLALGGRATSIKNYRDEFDPYFENSRQGWHNRPTRDHCSAIFQAYNKLDLVEFATLIASFLKPNIQEELALHSTIGIAAPNQTDISRAATGLAAETYFLNHFEEHFVGYKVVDTRLYGCGFDFKLNNADDFLCVEVKGLQQLKGTFLLTEKEYDVASQLCNRYCLYVVSNFVATPKVSILYNPTVECELTKFEQQIIQISYQGRL